MRLKVDAEADALYFRLDEEQVIENSEEVQPGIILDFDAQGQVVGVEILDLSARIAPAGLKMMRLDAGGTRTEIPLTADTSGT